MCKGRYDHQIYNFLFGDGTISRVYSLSPCSVCRYIVAYAQNALFIVNWFYLVFVYYKLNWPTNWVHYMYVASCHACVLITPLSLCIFHCYGNPEWESVELCGCIRSWVQFLAGALWIPHSFDNSHTYISVYTIKHSTIPFCIVWWASPIPFTTFFYMPILKAIGPVEWNGAGQQDYICNCVHVCPFPESSFPRLALWLENAKVLTIVQTFPSYGGTKTGINSSKRAANQAQ